MLNYKNLSRKFTQVLDTFKKSELEEWIEADIQREAFEGILDWKPLFVNVSDIHTLLSLYCSESGISNFETTKVINLEIDDYHFSGEESKTNSIAA